MVDMEIEIWEGEGDDNGGNEEVVEFDVFMEMVFLLEELDLCGDNGDKDDNDDG